MRVLLTLTLLLTTLQAINLRLTNNVISDADKNDILKSNGNDAFKKFLKVYSDVEPTDFKVSASSAAKNKIRAAEKKTFLKNLKKIKKHNKKFKQGKTKYTMTINSFAIMDDENLNQFLGMNISHSTHKYEIDDKKVSAGVSAFPSSLDWNQRGWMTGIKNQGQCNSCWTFPTNALLEFAYKGCTGNQIQLSEQQLVDCAYDGKVADTCAIGGDYTAAWNWIIENNHIAKMSDYQYKAKSSGYCDSSSYSSAIKNVMKLKGYTQVGSADEGATEIQAIQALQTMPLAIGMWFEKDLFAVGDGIYEGCRSISSTQYNHAVTLTAYTETYWEIKNSYGTDWGRNGYGRLERGRGSICNMLGYVYYIQYEDLDNSDGDDQTPTEADEDCKDINSSCSSVKDAGICGGQNIEWMQTYCKKSCGYC